MLAQVKYQQQETYFLIHVENQSYNQSELAKRIFKYFARLYEKYDLPIYPVVIFSFDEPKRPEPQNYRVAFADLNVLDFNFAAIQLNQLSWRDYLTQQNPVAAALMAKMNIPRSERPQVKAECLRLLTTLRLNPAKMQLISGFVDVYLNLNKAEEEVFKATADRMGLNNEEVYMEIITSWAREGLERGLQEGLERGLQEGLQEGRQQAQEEIALNLLRRGMTIEETVEITGLAVERVRELQARLQTEN
ncbi:Rpn family recombination-promoting nuclease/putative transposase [Fortiea contorta]|uniref:Rpn family recombination-promoting nuclease/putative transposase n=1 Tax=Fortiea contorta TaxID=1892405 RepID=UPI0003453EAF|nr:Rpn family recombination-promoting nuclease/putative transposase [Fortiea contorta]